jgi:hypothetical protein
MQLQPGDPPQADFPDPAFIGQFRTFGPLGPAYRVLAPVKRAEGGDWLLRVQVLNTGEETEYAYSHALSDPEAV